MIMKFLGGFLGLVMVLDSGHFQGLNLGHDSLMHNKLDESYGCCLRKSKGKDFGAVK